jgi:hypothetical protein
MIGFHTFQKVVTFRIININKYRKNYNLNIFNGYRISYTVTRPSHDLINVAKILESVFDEGFSRQTGLVIKYLLW